jgi:hypothetical protein
MAEHLIHEKAIPMLTVFQSNTASASICGWIAQ